MEIVRNVTEIEPTDRRALEHVLGRQLYDNQQVVMRVVTRDASEAPELNGSQAPADDGTLPEWCNVFEGLSDAEVAAIEEVMLTRADLPRPAE